MFLWFNEAGCFPTKDDPPDENWYKQIGKNMLSWKYKHEKNVFVTFVDYLEKNCIELDWEGARCSESKMSTNKST
jgi:hypothetical protein